MIETPNAGQGIGETRSQRSNQSTDGGSRRYSEVTLVVIFNKLCYGPYMIHMCVKSRIGPVGTSYYSFVRTKRLVMNFPTYYYFIKPTPHSVPTLKSRVEINHGFFIEDADSETRDRSFTFS